MPKIVNRVKFLHATRCGQQPDLGSRNATRATDLVLRGLLLCDPFHISFYAVASPLLF